ncbi:alpha/beta fold hydrolase [Aromatoleum diolicum]|uniref:Alpha/beta fold hydrolase n=1 Tax=Aromatoleum diolicum TaxID=75796 RepID=A0ABX1Q8N3_9RHOO|nr:alpha/beta fold hydrolase [Aromatoleum diolicum]NMG73495.1 alpha/beta fold hydrolase [Aromatoleum diolicum]
MEKMNLLLLPGLLNDASLFEHQADALADLVGITVADLTGSDSISALAADVLGQAPAGPFMLVGMSMGGYVAFEIMRQAGERVRALALLSTSARPDTPDATAAREELIALAETNFPAVIEKLLARMAHPEHANTPEVGGVFQSMATGLGQEVFVRQQRAIIGRADSRPSLASIRCPTLVLCGREDLVTPPEVHEELVAGIAGAQLAMIEECGHLLPLEQPEQVTTILRDWLSELVSPPRSNPN